MQNAREVTYKKFQHESFCANMIAGSDEMKQYDMDNENCYKPIESLAYPPRKQHISTLSDCSCWPQDPSLSTEDILKELISQAKSKRK